MRREVRACSAEQCLPPQRQWVHNKGRCGECGDPWDLPRPRPQETGGAYGTGRLARVYRRGQVGASLSSAPLLQ